MVPAHKIVFHAIETPFLSIGRGGEIRDLRVGVFWPRETLLLPPMKTLEGDERAVSRQGIFRGWTN